MVNFTHENGRIFAAGADGRAVAEVVFPDAAPGVADIRHTFVDESLRGQGIAGRLVEAAARQLRREHKKAILTCSYAKKWFGEHPEYSDLLADRAE